MTSALFKNDKLFYNICIYTYAFVAVIEIGHGRVLAAILSVVSDSGTNINQSLIYILFSLWCAQILWSLNLHFIRPATLIQSRHAQNSNLTVWHKIITGKSELLN